MFVGLISVSNFRCSELSDTEYLLVAFVSQACCFVQYTDMAASSYGQIMITHKKTMFISFSN